METQTLAPDQSSVYQQPAAPSPPPRPETPTEWFARQSPGKKVLLVVGCILGTLMLVGAFDESPSVSTTPTAPVAQPAPAPVQPKAAPAAPAITRTRNYPSTAAFCDRFFAALNSGDLSQVLAVSEWGLQEVEAGRIHPAVADATGEALIYIGEGDYSPSQTRQVGENLGEACGLHS